MTSAPELRIGILGVARISGDAVVLPARALGHRLVAVASRDPARAQFFADLCAVERVAPSYEALLADPEVDVVYLPLPNALHARWTLAAIAAGKHVLCEKPLAATAEEARAVRAAAAAAGVHVHEAAHQLCHPLYTALARELDGLGKVRHAAAQITMRPPPPEDPRWSAGLGGGALMDLGCYGLQVLGWLGRWAGGGPEVVAAAAELRDGVDSRSTVRLVFPSGATGTVHASMVAADPAPHSLRIECEGGVLDVAGFVLPHLGGALTVLRADGRRSVTEFDAVSTYQHQLRRFAELVRAGRPMPTSLADSVATMALLDDARHRFH
ncbi:Gfo/Idh/MocA family protein [Tomitella biformata]|uniref:Gfo/Idh/MocA family protein n=1 Tax=Tomitella biformata TaxID=630403 RepID=UPI000465B16F|nr:Gfo/Idh/MocA family oxidoreductase [Tomitella biformata]